MFARGDKEKRTDLHIFLGRLLFPRHAVHDLFHRHAVLLDILEVRIDLAGSSIAKAVAQVVVLGTDEVCGPLLDLGAVVGFAVPLDGLAKNFLHFLSHKESWSSRRGEKRIDYPWNWRLGAVPTCVCISCWISGSMADLVFLCASSRARMRLLYCALASLNRASCSSALRI